MKKDRISDVFCALLCLITGVCIGTVYGDWILGSGILFAGLYLLLPNE